jgi:hypothetical protein
MFTVWKDMQGKVACEDRGREWWDLFEGAGVGDAVYDKAIEKLGDNFADVPLLHAARDDDTAIEHGVENEFCDLEASLCLLEFGVTLVKLPDELEGKRSKYWRMYAVGPLPSPWKEQAEHDAELEACCV